MVKSFGTQFKHEVTRRHQMPCRCLVGFHCRLGHCSTLIWQRPLFREIHGRSPWGSYPNGTLSGGGPVLEKIRVRMLAISRAVSSQGLATEKPVGEEAEKKPLQLRPSSLYRRISRLGDPKNSAVAALERWINEGGRPRRWQLKLVVKELRKYHRYKHALEISEWMSSYKTFGFSPGDHAIHLDLISKVHGIASAEKYFSELPDIAKNHLTYSALLNCYVKEKLTEKTEAIMEKLKLLGFTTSTLLYNEIMTLYMNTNQFEKVPLVIQEMKENGVLLDTFSYNIWLTMCAAVSDLDQMDKVVDEMKQNDNVNTDWVLYSTLANIYIKVGLLDDAECALKELEKHMVRSDRDPYNYLISLHASLGNKEEVYRIWESFQLAFPRMTNKSYICLLSSLVKIGDIEGAEKFFEEWESVRLSYDANVPNVLLGAYIRKGWLQKAEACLKRIVVKGGQPNANTWEIFAEGYIGNRQIDRAVEAMKKALSILKITSWRPKSANVLAILNHFEKDGDVESAKEYFKILREVNYVSTDIYNSLIRTYVQAGKATSKISEYMKEDNICPNEETDMLLTQASET